jgi:hypothetical protein
LGGNNAALSALRILRFGSCLCHLQAYGSPNVG